MLLFCTPAIGRTCIEPQGARHTSHQPRHTAQDMMKILPPLADASDLAKINDALREGGAIALVRHLNARVPHRITAFYRLRGEWLANICMHDKFGVLQDEMFEDVPLTDSFCQFALRDGFFETQDSSTDDRLVDHIYRGQVLSYHGVPVVDESGEVAGSLCHLDYLRQSLSRIEFEVLRAAALLLQPHLDTGRMKNSDRRKMA